VRDHEPLRRPLHRQSHPALEKGARLAVERDWFGEVAQQIDVDVLGVALEDNPARYEYRLTNKGADLYPVLLSLAGWGDKYKNGVPPMRLIHRGCGHAAKPRMTCSHCGEPLSWREMTAEFEPDAW
jgi:HxlR-like helix-turn-helix